MNRKKIYKIISLLLFFVIVSFLILFLISKKVSPVGRPENKIPDVFVSVNEINWPEQYNPKNNPPIYISNEIKISAPPEKVWNNLIRAESYPKWYEGASNVKVQRYKDGILRENSIFTWKTAGFEIVSKIKEFVPPYRLSWEFRNSTFVGYHAWLVIPMVDGGTKVITEEVQYGFLAKLQSIFSPDNLRKMHDKWLMGLKNISE